MSIISIRSKILYGSFNTTLYMVYACVLVAWKGFKLVSAKDSVVECVDACTLCEVMQGRQVCMHICNQTSSENKVLRDGI